MAISASNLAVILATWLAIDAVVSVLHRGRNASEERSPFMPLRLVSVVLGLGILWLGIRYHTTDLEGLLTSVLQDRQLDAAQVRSGMAIVIAAALAWRSGLFPSILWIQRLIASPAPDSLSVAWISAVSIVVPAVALLWRMQSLWALCPDAAFLISAFGALTCLICGVSACVRSVDESVDATLGSTTLWCLLIGIGQTCIALAAGRSDQVGPSAYFATFGVPLLAVVASCAWQPTRFKFLVGSAVAVLTSGMLGQEAALQFAQTVVGAQSGDAARSVLGFNLAKSALAVWMTGLIGQMLVGFALVKSICRDSEARDSTHPVTDSQNRLDWGRVIISGAVIAIWVLFGLMARSSDSTAKPGAVTWLDLHQHLFSPSAAEGATRLLTMGVTLPAGWLGCLVAWVLWSLKPKLGMQLARLLEPLLRVPRNGWYLEAIVRWVIVRPVRFASSVVETFDRRLLGGGREGAWSQPASSTAEFFDTSRHAAGRYSLMAMCGAAVALLIVLMLR